MAKLPLPFSLILSVLSFGQTAVGASWPPTASYVAPLGLASDPAFNTLSRRDGGGGGFVNGYHLAGFADSITQTVPDSQNTISSFAHNTFAYMGYTNYSDPTLLYDFGNITDGVGTFSNEFVATDNETETIKAFAIWATGNYVPSEDGTQAIGVMNCLNENPGTPEFPGDQIYYNTLVAINVTDPQDLPAGQTWLDGERLVPRLFYGTENLYGSFTLYRGLDNYLYLFGTSASIFHGLTAARVPISSITDRKMYTYWNGAEWSQEQPNMYDASANIFNYTSPVGNGPATGEVFFSPYYNYTMSIFMDSGVDGTFWLTYPTSADLTGPWSEPVELYTPEAPTETPCYSGDQWNYAGHSYPDYDPSGKTILLSWSSCESFVHMATLVWDE